MAKELFKEGATVEVSLEDEGFRGSWYTAIVLCPHIKKTNNNQLYLEFDTLTFDDKATKRHREFVDVVLVPPGREFFEMLFSSFNKHVDFDSVKCVVIGSPGSIKKEFWLYLLSESHKLKIKSIENNKSRLVLVDTCSGNKSALKEVLNDIKVMNLIKNTKSTIEIKLFNEFRDMLSSNSDQVCYGLKNVEMVLELMAIETLMITEELFRNYEISTRQKYIVMVKSVKEAGGKAVVLPAVKNFGEILF